MTLLLDIARVIPRLTEADLPKFYAWFDKFSPHLGTIDANLYSRLTRDERERFLVWSLKRWAKIDLVNPVERGLYMATVQRIRTERREAEMLDGRPYLVRDFSSQGHDFKLLGYNWFLGVHDILYNQYEHNDFVLRQGDVIIDAGAFIGDTAVFFHHRLKGDCEIHSFELLDENVALIVNNLERNGVREDQVTINKLALADRTGEKIAIDAASGSTAAEASANIVGKNGGKHIVETVTLDDYVVATGLSKVDLIKMDIEGAEVAALRGAVNTIRLFRPRLAICLYHKWDDMITVPQAILDSGVEYRFGFKWVQMRDGLEAVLHASPVEEGEHINTLPKAEPASNAEQVFTDALAALARQGLRHAAHLDAAAQALRHVAAQQTALKAVG